MPCIATLSTANHGPRGRVYRQDAPPSDHEPRPSRPGLRQGAGSATELVVVDVMSIAQTQPISPIDDRLLDGLSYQQGSTTDLSIFTDDRRRLNSCVPAASRSAPSSSESVSVPTLQLLQRSPKTLEQAICGDLESSQAEQQFRTTRLFQAELW